MRVPKRNAGLITKALGLGIWKRGPKHWAEVHRQRKNGIFDRENCAKGGRAGGKVTGRANKQLGRGICAPGAHSLAGKVSAQKNKERGAGPFSHEFQAKSSEALKGCWADPVWREMQRWRIREGMKRKKSGSRNFATEQLFQKMREKK